MEDLILEPTKRTPSVTFINSGKLVLAGSLYSENAAEFFDPLLKWIENLKASTVDFDIIIEYMNTASAKQLLRLLMILRDNKDVTNATINWFYQKDDEETLETGEILNDSLKGINFKFVVFDQ